MKKRILLFALLVSALLLLAGCGEQIEERAMADISALAYSAEVTAPETDEYASSQEYVTLYFFAEDGVTLSPVVREITLPGGVSRGEAALCALLDGPQEGEKGVSWPEVVSRNTVRRIEISGHIATVDLPARVRELPQEQIFALRQAVTNTLSEFTEISYVNVLVGGREEGLDLGATLPAGTLTRVNDPDMGDMYTRLISQRQQAAGITALTTLYFPSEDGRHLLPQVRTVTYGGIAPIEYLYQLLDELGRGSGRGAGVPAPMEYITEMPEIVRTEDGAFRAIEIMFDAALDTALAQAGLTRSVYLAMLTDTLMGFVPGVEGLQVSIGGKMVTSLGADETPDGEEIVFQQAIATRADFSGYAGAPVTIYVRSEDGNRLERTEYIVPQSRRLDLRTRLESMMTFSQETERFALPSGLTAQDVLAVRADSKEICVNLSENFAARMRTLSPREERTAVYAMVNTLTEGYEAQRVRFFFDGQQPQTLSGGLDMRGAFTRNPGMVVD